MSIAMRMKIGDLSADNARGRGGFGAGVYWGVGVKVVQGVSTGWAKKFENISNFSPFRDVTSIYLRNY